MRLILDKISSSPFMAALLSAYSEGRPVGVKSLAGSLQTIVPALIHQRRGEPVFLIYEDRADADEAYSDVHTLLGDEHVLLYQEEHHTRATIRDSIDSEVVSLTGALTLLDENPNRVIISDVETIVEKVPSPTGLAESLMELRVGQIIGLEQLAKRLALGGFERTDFVQSVGQFAMRGGIIDLFAPGAEYPLRVEFFGEEIESIREFEPLSQRSVRDRQFVELMAKVFHSDLGDALSSTILDHLPPNTTYFLEEPERLYAILTEMGHGDIAGRLQSSKQIQHSEFFSASGESDASGRKLEIVEASSVAQPSFSSSVRELCKALDRQIADGYDVFLLSDGEETRRRAEDLVQEEWQRAEEEETPYESLVSAIHFENETLTHGFIIPDSKLAVIAEHEVFRRQRARVSRKRGKQFKGFTLRELRQLRHGDFVVHVDKGIGKFVGLQTITAAGSRAEAVKLEYAAGDILFVNLSYINRLQKYSSKEGAHPRLNRLGTEEWERTKARAKKRVKDIARELIRLYALRKMQPGIQYPPDTIWQRELEATFMYVDTPDQASATYAVKQDMESPHPMDRLVCGDVGFGKTEVAVRAAFKAVQHGKQVAILAPTTILAQQHFNTFRDRLSRYAVNVGILSRFRSKAQQTETLVATRAGAVDVLIGTHRILSKDVRFKDLGLLIIDEEQRFGVAAKEKLRQVRTAVDTLTLTATPIPRTLNFSLMGARDLSTIETPPRNRLPIVTEILQWSDDAVAEAIEKEVAHGGQCFVVHWRIGDIDELAGKISELVPKAKVMVAHGEMSSERLEKTVMAFIEKQFNVLVTTKIVESGIDIPSVNTIIINHAEKFGLAELYQLRGRVGRSNVQAYCYLVIPPPSSLSRIALKRLQAIQELSELGSGLKLAMRDLEIRGAGNLLGAEQSGFIEDVGFELYQRIVDEAVEELKRDEFRDLFREQLADEAAKVTLPLNPDMVIEIEGDALIPKGYIQDDSERYDFYVRIYAAASTTALSSLASELRDRFGPLPDETARLFEAVGLRLSGMGTGAHRLSLRDSRMRLELPPQSDAAYYERWFQPLMSAVSKDPMVQLETKGNSLAVVFTNISSAIEAQRTLDLFVRRIAEAGGSKAEVEPRLEQESLLENR